MIRVRRTGIWRTGLVLAIGLPLLWSVLLLSTPGRSHAAARRFAGRWAMLQVITTAAKVPVIGTIYSRTRIVTLHRLGFRDGRLSGKGALCRMHIDTGTDLVQAIVPRAFLRSLPTPLFDAKLTYQSDTWQLYQPRQYAIVGVRLKDKKREKLPTDAADPRVQDQDGDGKPGVTIRVKGLVDGEIYLAQRSWTLLRGTLQAPGRFSGSVQFDKEQSVLDATSWLLKDPFDARPALERSYFYLIRVGRRTTCGQAMKLLGVR